MGHTVVVDSSVFVAAFKGNERFSESALRFVEQIERGRYNVHVPLTVLVEVVTAVARETKSVVRAERAGRSLRAWPTIHVIDQFTGLDEEFLFEFAASGVLKGMDVFVAVAALTRGFPLVSLDQALRRSVKGRVPTPTLEDLV